MGRRIATVFGALALGAIGACVSQSNPLAPGDDAGGLTFDAALPDEGVALEDAGSDALTGHDSSTSDAGTSDGGAFADSTDAEALDSSDATLAADARDAAEPDASDATLAPDASDAAEPIDVIDAGADASDAAPFDAGPPECAVNVFGEYYTRADGSVVSWVTGNVVVVIDSTSAVLTGITTVYPDAYAACALRNDGTVWCWPSFSGNNTGGQLGNGTLVDAPSGQYFRATQVLTAGADGGVGAPLDDVVALPTGSRVGVAGGGDTGLCAVRGDATLWCWGPTTQGDLWEGTIGTTADLALATPIRMVPPGDAGSPDSTDAGDIAHVAQVSMGSIHACFVDTSGAVYCWGGNTRGELGQGDSTPRTYPTQVTANLPGNVASVHAGANQTCALAGGEVWCWGQDLSYSEVGDPYVDASICNSNYCVPLPAPVQFSLPDGGSQMAPLVNVSTLFVGYLYSCALDVVGNTMCWGAQTGTPTLLPEATPFVNPAAGSGVPSGPNKSLSCIGSGGVNGSLTYVTTSGVLVQTTQVMAQYCQ